jgi:DNA-binding CsgD family transcriptional regulator
MFNYLSRVVQEILFIVFIFLSLGAGIGAILLVNSLQKSYNLNYLNSYLYHQILTFIFGLYGLIGLAVVKWILQELETPAATVETIANFIPYLGIPFVIAAWYMFIKLSVEIAGSTISSKLTFSYFVSMLLIILGYGYLIVYLFRTQSENAQMFSDYAKYVFAGIEIFTLLIAYYFLYIRGARIKHKRFRKAVRIFAHIKLIFSLAGILLFFFAENDPLFAGAYIFIFFAGDIPAIVYLGNYLNKYYLTTSGKTDALSPYEDFITNYQISKREWEIIEKVSEGLTNRQISETLFISLQTVKDHTHRIYRKTGVKNRVQLVNMIREMKIADKENVN